MEELRSRYHGALLGLAIGDALGTALEFQRPGTFEPITDMVGGGPFGLEPGQWTDDTSVALCLAASLVENGGFDARDQMDRYLRWWHEGFMSSTGECFDIGRTMSAALRIYEHTGDPFSGPTDKRTAGNGYLMRLAPTPLFYCRDPDKAIHYAAESSRTTHRAREAVDACRYFAGLIVGALLAVNLGEGADTTCAIYGQIAGAYYGESGTPGSWVERLCMREVICDLEDRLYDLAASLGEGSRAD